MTFTEAETWALWDALNQPTEAEIADIAEHNADLASALRQLQEWIT